MVGGETWGDVSRRIDSVDVSKTVVHSESEGVTVSVEIVSNRDHPTTVTITDPLPDEENVRELRFVNHTTDWVPLGGAVRFERTLRAGEEILTEYEFRYTGSDRFEASSELPAVDVDPNVDVISEDTMVRGGSATATPDDRGVGSPAVDSQSESTETTLSQPPTDEELEEIAERAEDRFESAPRVYHLRVFFPASATPEDRVALYDGIDGWFHVLANAPSREVIGSRAIETVLDVVVATADDLSGLESTFEKLSYVDSVTMSAVRGDSSASDGSAESSDPEPTAGDQASTPNEEFDDLRTDVDVLEAEELIEDDEYQDFVGEIDDFSVPNDELSLDEVMTYTGTAAESDDADAESDRAGENLSSKWNDESDAPVTEALLDELDRGLPDEQERRFRRTFRESPRSLEARVTHLQARFQDLEAYVDALEAFLNERGTAETILDELRSDLTSVREDVSQLRERQTEHETQFETVSGDLDHLSTRLDDHEAAVAADLQSVEESITALDEELSTVKEDVKSLTEWRDELKKVVSGS